MTKHSCHDAQWLNAICHDACRMLLNDVSDRTGEDPQTVATTVGHDLIVQAAAMICVAAERDDMAKPLGLSLLNAVIATMEHAAQMDGMKN